VNQLTVRDLMTAGVVCVGRCTPLADVIEVMREGQFRHVPVVDDEDEVIGIVSDRDLARLIGRTPPGWAFDFVAQTTAERAMSAPVETIDPDDTLRDAAERMFGAKIGCLPVVEGRHLVGILTESDFVRYVALGDE
jgi:acetoin utilization protein AcuB